MNMNLKERKKNVCIEKKNINKATIRTEETKKQKWGITRHTDRDKKYVCNSIVCNSLFNITLWKER